MPRIKSAKVNGEKDVSIKVDEDGFRAMIGSSVRGLSRGIRYFQHYSGEEILLTELCMHIQILELSVVIKKLEFNLKTKKAIRKVLSRVDNLILTMEGISETEKQAARPNREILEYIKTRW